MNLFQTVKSGIRTREAAERYGIAVNRYGKALCPFHNDRHPSLFVADDHYHCFACGAHGDTIDLVSRLYDLPLYDAAKKLAQDFGITKDNVPVKDIQDNRRMKNEAQLLKENEQLCFSVLEEYTRLLQQWKRQYAPQTPEDCVDERFVEACHLLDYAEYLVDLLNYGDSHERIEVVNSVMADGRLQRLQDHLKKQGEEQSCQM